MKPPEDEQNRAWIAQWRRSAAALDQVKREELRTLTEESAGRIFAEMIFDPETMWISPERAAAAGLIEQQRLFMSSHEHPARSRRRP